MASVRNARFRRAGSICVVGAAVAGAIAGPTAHASPPDFAALKGTRPYLRMFTESPNCQAIKQMNNLPSSQETALLGNVAKWYVHVHYDGSNGAELGAMCQGASPTTLAAKLASQGLMVSTYRNGSYLSQARPTDPNFHEASLIEAQAPLSIATFWPGQYRIGAKANPGVATLPLAISSTTTSIHVRTSSGVRPGGAATTWPYIDSRGLGLGVGAHSLDTHNFVSWIRIDNEMMQVVTTPTLTGSLDNVTVRRGIFGTKPTSHLAGARVYSPVYVGSGGAAAAAAIDGSPRRDSTSVALRYGIKIWQPDAYNWIASRIRADFGPGFGGHNAVWLDVSSCVQFNVGDAWGDAVAGWYDAGNTVMTQDLWGHAQATKVQGLRRALPGLKFSVNSVGATARAVVPCNEKLLSTAVDLGSLEGWMKSGSAVASSTEWQAEMPMNFAIMANNWPALFWLRWNFHFTGDTSEYQRLAYASALLAYRPTATRYQFGGAFQMAQPPSLFFWNWGTPLSTATSVSGLAVPGTALYRRDFVNGTILVNPSNSTATLPLGSTHYDCVHLDKSGNPTAVSTATVPAHDAAFLLNGR